MTRVGLLILLLFTAQASADEPAVDYRKQIKPIFKARCYACHGALKQKSNLRLDTGAAVRKGGDGGAAVMPKKADASPLIERITAKDESLRMPPEGMPLTPAEIALIKRWIQQGAKSPTDEKPEEDPRTHWAFVKPKRPRVPPVRSAAAVRNPIDAFLAARQERAGVTPSPPASKPILLRRVSLDLIGLPPTRAELRAFLRDESPDAYEKAVDRLLNSPRYGERWGRHWMDVWRYSDWYGRRHVPDVWNSASQIWRWRDWIVRSLNRDHGYDRMLREMLAADEIRPADYEAGVATGYLVRNWYALNPNDWMRNTVEHTGKAFLGLTFNCAHCHDHKYDPITQADYFRLRAFFEPIYVRQDRVPGEADPGPFQDYEYSKLRKIQRLGAVRIFDKNPNAPTWFYTGGDERNRVKERGSIKPGVPAFLDEWLPKIKPVKLPPRAWYPGSRPGIRETVLTDARSAVERAKSELAAAGKQGKPGLRAAEAKLAAASANLAAVESRIAADRATFGGSPAADATEFARAASQAEREAAVKQAEFEVLSHEQTLAKAKAKSAKLKKQLAAAQAALKKAKTALADKKLDQTYTPFSPKYPRTSTGRRRALAEWITSRDNPLTARVAVNHIWLRHFHAPLVKSVDNFGRNGAEPTHPELLDWLAVELMDSGWRMKHLHRLIVTSAAYRRSSSAVGQAFQPDANGRNGAIAEETPGQAGKPDPRSRDSENTLLWRMNAGRLEAEVLRDSLLHLAGNLEQKMEGQELENSQSLTTHRRSLYYAVYPEQGGKSPLGELFDGPDALECYRRTRSIVPQQALALTNSDLVHRVSAGLAKHVWDDAQSESRAASESGKRFLVAAFERILSRPPDEQELRVCTEFLARHANLASPVDAAKGQVQARESLVRALLNHNDFIAIR